MVAPLDEWVEENKLGGLEEAFTHHCNHWLEGLDGENEQIEDLVRMLMMSLRQELEMRHVYLRGKTK